MKKRNFFPCVIAGCFWQILPLGAATDCASIPNDSTAASECLSLFTKQSAGDLGSVVNTLRKYGGIYKAANESIDNYVAPPVDLFIGYQAGQAGPDGVLAVYGDSELAEKKVELSQKLEQLKKLEQLIPVVKPLHPTYENIADANYIAQAKKSTAELRAQINELNYINSQLPLAQRESEDASRLYYRNEDLLLRGLGLQPICGISGISQAQCFAKSQQFHELAGLSDDIARKIRDIDLKISDQLQNTQRIEETLDRAVTSTGQSNIRTVNWHVTGKFISATGGVADGVGTSRVSWGVPLGGSFQSSLSIDEYVFPANGDLSTPTTFPIGRIKFRNGTVSSGSISATTLQIYLFPEYDDGSYSLTPIGLAEINIGLFSTPNINIEPSLNADGGIATGDVNHSYVFFALEEKTASFQPVVSKNSPLELINLVSLDEFGFLSSSTNPADAIPVPASLMFFSNLLLLWFFCRPGRSRFKVP